ncbi:MAG: PD-(D/E)XK nuclease family transposase [Clostridiales bacterium]|nr:PD-(D/E)XK nuclease family transposase [Clostridiales bacterium]
MYEFYVDPKVREEDRRQIKKLCLFDDDFFCLCFEGHPECTQLLLRIILDMPDIVVISSEVQSYIQNVPGSRSVRLDVKARDADGKLYNIEIQTDPRGASPQRARYYSSIIDSSEGLPPGSDFPDLPDSYVIFITRDDIIGDKKAVSWIKRMIVGTEREFKDGSNIIFVNGEYAGNDPVGRLISDLKACDAASMNYSELADRVGTYKNADGGYKMESYFDKIRRESLEAGKEEAKKEMESYCDRIRRESLEAGKEAGKEEGMIKVAESMIKDAQLPPEKIALYSNLPLEKILEMMSSSAGA